MLHHCLFRFLGLFLLLFGVGLSAFPQDGTHPREIIENGREWADSVYNTLSPEERISQLFWLTVEASAEPHQRHHYVDLVEKWQPGGIIFFRNDIKKALRMSNYMQELSDVPLFVVADGELGLGMRFNETISYPRAMTLGAVQDNDLIEKLGKEVARQFREAGIHVNLAPVGDVNNNPDNPVIGTRSFGEEPENVAKKSAAFLTGLQKGGVMGVAKHFPGHGDTDKDSHKTLPYIPHSRAHLNRVEMPPFSAMIDSGAWGVMTAHLEVPALEPEEGLPASFSPAVIQGVLRDSLGFGGLVITDAVNMQGAKTVAEPGRVDALALKAGNDIVEYTEDLPGAIQAVQAMIAEGEITWQEIEEKCKKALAFKHHLGLTETPYVDAEGLMERLVHPEARLLEHNLYEAASTVLLNQDEAIPLRNLDEGDFACVVAGEAPAFEKRVNSYREMPVFRIGKEDDEDKMTRELKRIQEFDRLVVVITSESRYLPDHIKDSLIELMNNRESVAAFLDNPYQMSGWYGLENIDGLMVGYQDNDVAQDVAAQVLFGGVGATGRLPVSVDGRFSAGDGMDTSGELRLRYSLPEAEGMDSRRISTRVDSILNKALAEKAFPGCQVLVARRGNVIFHEAYGFHTYEERQRVRRDDLYDLASVTKITGPLPVLMELTEEERIDLDAPVSDYFSDWESGFFRPSNKEDLIFRDVLAHQSGLTSYIAYWRRAMKKNRYARRWFNLHEGMEVDDHLYLKERFKRKMYRSIRKSELEEEKEYRYSGLSFMIYPRMISEMTGTDYETLVDSSFYSPLGASSLMYNPLRKYSLQQITPTEYDSVFRKKQIHGRVHDEAAAVMGGVSGNAGLFANANDLAKLMQMYLNDGEYGGRRYLDSTVVREFTRRQFPENDNRRGLGFDKPKPGNDTLSVDEVYPAPGASQESFGHSGFTGTFVWMDPHYDLLYIFLSNRVYPDRSNRKIYEMNVRTAVQQVFYDELKK
ncbi:MAG: glycoside hydrolase family 3 N-terminal domain-containing protein [Marinilabiliaceae bacterium]